MGPHSMEVKIFNKRKWFGSIKYLRNTKRS